MTETLARGLIERGHEVIVLGAPGSALESRISGIAQYEGVLKGMDLHPLSVARARKALIRNRAQVVLAMMKKDVRLAGPAASLCGIPTVVRHANDRPLTGWVYDRFLFGHLPAAHIANSRATMKTLLESASWLRQKKLEVVYNGVDCASIEAAAAADFDLPDGAIVVTFAARLERRKGLMDLMAAWPAVAASVPQAHLLVVGKGPDEAEARSVTADAPGIHWLGYRGDVASVLRASDIAVVPSHWEGFGLIAAEAMCARLPVVAARASSLPEIILEGETGILVPPRSPAQLAEALVRLARDPELRQRLGESGRERAAKRFSQAGMINEYERILGQVVRHPGV